MTMATRLTFINLTLSLSCKWTIKTRTTKHRIKVIVAPKEEYQESRLQELSQRISRSYILRTLRLRRQCYDYLVLLFPGDLSPYLQPDRSLLPAHN
jgi:hypothetical protein